MAQASVDVVLSHFDKLFELQDEYALAKQCYQEAEQQFFQATNGGVNQADIDFKSALALTFYELTLSLQNQIAVAQRNLDYVLALFLP